jgi:hypothetical protein
MNETSKEASGDRHQASGRKDEEERGQGAEYRGKQIADSQQ